MRFVANWPTTYASAASLYWAIYTNMTAASPSGPGWVSVGEGNGSVGGMGTTGLFSSPGDFANNSWFVLERPDGGSQIMFYRNTDSNAVFYRYSKGALYTGGDGSTTPTAIDDVYTDGDANGANATLFNLVADDEPPYGWFWFTYNGSMTNILNAGYIPLNTYVPGDTDPYVLYLRAFTAFYVLSIDVIMTGDGCRCWDPTGTVFTDVFFPTISAGINTVWPSNPPNDVNGNPILFDGMYTTTAASPQTFWKGTSSFVRWANSTQSEATRILGGKFIQVGNIYLPWNNTPIP
jgi:hypothetical protein